MSTSWSSWHNRVLTSQLCNALLKALATNRRPAVNHRSEKFPRATELPTQSPLFWVEQKDRYLRQLLIRDIEELTSDVSLHISQTALKAR
jgi:hypothetical protein